MNKSKKLVFFGTETFSVPSLLALLEANWPIAYVVTKPDSRSGRGLKYRYPAVKEAAVHHGLTVIQPNQVNDINAQLAASGASAGVLAAYGKILSPTTIDLFPQGIINLHPSLLPKYRGPSPIEAAILAGDKQTGLSLMKLTEHMDAGPVYWQLPVKLTGQEYKDELVTKMAQLGANLLVEKLESILNGELVPVPQVEADATYTKLIAKRDGVIDWRSPAQAIERQVRAYQGYPKSRAKLFDKYDVIITRVKVVAREEAGQLVIKCQPGLLQIDELVAPSGRLVKGADFLRGYSAN